MKTLLVALVAMIAGCGKTTPFACETSRQCVRGADQGVCVQGACAFMDSSCPGGYKFDPGAGGGLAGTCTTAVDGGAPDVGGSTCGAIGQACCASDPVCAGGASCTAGTCQACDIDVSLGRRFTCVLERDHTVWCAGANDGGQLGTGIAGAPSATRVQVRDSTGVVIADATAIASGREQTCAIRSGGAVWCWGEGQTAAAQVSSAAGPLANIAQVDGGSNFACARDGSGGVWCWGDNSQGELGDGTTTSRATAAAVLVAAGGAPLTGATDLVIGGRVACIRQASGDTWCWGANDHGQFGDGTTTNHPMPVMIGTTTSVAPGMSHLCFVTPDSSVTCAGWTSFGRLGAGGFSTAGYFSSTNQTTRTKVLTATGAPFTGVKQMAAGGVSCAVMQDASLECWGDSIHGQTGNGGSTTPLPVRRLDGTAVTGVDRLVVKYAHACAHTTTGEWLCWGRNGQGELGDGTFANRGFAMPLKASCP